MRDQISTINPATGAITDDAMAQTPKIDGKHSAQPL